MNYYFSITHSTNHYNAINLTSIAIVRDDGKELFLEGVSKAKFRKGVKKFLSEDNDAPKFYTYFTAMAEVAFMSIDYSFTYFRDLNFLEDYISEKVGPDFSVKEDSKYPFAEPNETPIEEAKRLKQLHKFLIDFELNLQVRAIRKKIGL